MSRLTNDEINELIEEETIGVAHSNVQNNKRNNKKIDFDKYVDGLYALACNHPERGKDIVAIFEANVKNNNLKNFDENCNILSVVVNNSPELAEDVLNIVETRVQNRERFDFGDYAETLYQVAKNRPELNKDVFDIIQTSYDKGYNFYYCSKILPEVAKNYPESRKEAFEMLNQCNVTDDYYSDLHSFAENCPEFGKDILKTVVNDIAPIDNNDYNPMYKYYTGTLSQVVTDSPELGKDVLNIIKEHAERFGVGYFAYVLSTIAESCPELEKEVLDVVKGDIKSSKEVDFSKYHKVLSEVVKTSPELGKEALDLVKGDIKSSKEVDFSKYHKVLSEVVKTSPELGKDVFDIIKANEDNCVNFTYCGDTFAEIAINCPEHRKEVFEMLDTIRGWGYYDESMLKLAKKCPELGKDVLAVLQKDISKNPEGWEAGSRLDYDEYRDALCGLATNLPELGKGVLNMVKTDLQNYTNFITEEKKQRKPYDWYNPRSYDNDAYIYTKTYSLLSKISKNNLELKNDVRDIITTMASKSDVFMNVIADKFQKDFQTDLKYSVSKKRVLDSVEAVKTRREEAVSGAVVADEIAGKRRSGEVKEPVTPAKGNKLSAEIQAKIKEMKGNTKD